MKIKILAKTHAKYKHLAVIGLHNWGTLVSGLRAEAEETVDVQNRYLVIYEMMIMTYLKSVAKIREILSRVFCKHGKEHLKYLYFQRVT
jgi:hypothetical protein